MKYVLRLYLHHIGLTGQRKSHGEAHVQSGRGPQIYRAKDIDKGRPLIGAINAISLLQEFKMISKF